MFISYNPTNNRFIYYDNYIDMMDDSEKNDELIPYFSNSQEDIDTFINTHTFHMTLEEITNNLLPKQIQAIHLINNGNSIFITGPPGTGKSFLLKRVLDLLKINHKNICLTATTGCAAVNIGGRTLHSLFNIKPFTDNFDVSHVNQLKYKKKEIYRTIKNLDVLIIDEVSMLDNILCDGIDNILRIIKNNDNPFGGIQMIFVGDFYQLPPVTNNFCFVSKSWQQLNPKIIELTELVRQKDDNVFKAILMAIRKRKIGPILINHLKSLKNTKFQNGIVPTRLFPKNFNVDHINKLNIDSLRDGRLFKTYSAFSKGIDLNNEYHIELCNDAQVMVTRNINIIDGIVNGTRGIVADISNDREVTIKLIDGREAIIPYTKDYQNNKMTTWIEFMPLKIAYAMSIHKSQGMTLDAIEIDLGSSVFENGQAYTALSRGKKLEHIRIIDIEKNSFKTHPLVVEYYQKDS